MDTLLNGKQNHPDHPVQSIAFWSIYEQEPLYRALLQSQSHIKGNRYMGEITRPVIRSRPNRIIISTPGNMWNSLSNKRSTRRS